MTVAELERALRAAGVVHTSAALLPSMVAVTVYLRDPAQMLVPPTAITGEGGTLEDAAKDALRKVGVR